MNDELILNLGDAAMRLLGDDDLNTIKQLFEAQAVSAWLSTKRPDTDTREEMFSTVQAVREFFDFMNELVSRKVALETPTTQDTTDDPRVHDIYSDEELIAND